MVPEWQKALLAAVLAAAPGGAVYSNPADPVEEEFLPVSRVVKTRAELVSLLEQTEAAAIVRTSADRKAFSGMTIRLELYFLDSLISSGRAVKIYPGKVYYSLVTIILNGAKDRDAVAAKLVFMQRTGELESSEAPPVRVRLRGGQIFEVVEETGR